MSGDNALTRDYLRFLIERITVTDNRIDLTARSESAVQMIAVANDEKSPADLNDEADSPTYVVGWLQR